jgi:hypothetical protein
MITKVEINGYEITIEENEGLITVKAEKDEEIIEEFSIETEEAQEGEESEEGEGIKSFDDFGGEEEDFGSQDEEESQEEEEESELGEEMQDEEEESENKLESFQSFINKKK